MEIRSFAIILLALTAGCGTEAPSADHKNTNTVSTASNIPASENVSGNCNKSALCLRTDLNGDGIVDDAYIRPIKNPETVHLIAEYDDTGGTYTTPLKAGQDAITLTLNHSDEKISTAREVWALGFKNAKQLTLYRDYVAEQNKVPSECLVDGDERLLVAQSDSATWVIFWDGASPNNSGFSARYCENKEPKQALASNAATITGQWKVTHLFVDVESRAQAYATDDPEVVGSVMTISNGAKPDIFWSHLSSDRLSTEDKCNSAHIAQVSTQEADWTRDALNPVLKAWQLGAVKDSDMLSLSCGVGNWGQNGANSTMVRIGTNKLIMPWTDGGTFLLQRLSAR